MDRQVLAVDEVAELQQVLTELPGSIPVDEAEGLMVRIDPQQVKDSAGYSVQAMGTMATVGGGERIVRGFLPNFQANYSSLYYLPYQNRYFPYYRSGDMYLPMYSILTRGDSRAYPFFRRQWGFYYPSYYTSLSARSFFLGVWSGTLGLMERAGAWSGVHPGSPVLLRPEMPIPPQPTEPMPAPVEPTPEPTEPEPTPEEPTPTEPTPTEPTPTEPTPTEPTPTEPTPTEPTPTEPTPTEPTPTEPAPEEPAPTAPVDGDTDTGTDGTAEAGDGA